MGREDTVDIIIRAHDKASGAFAKIDVAAGGFGRTMSSLQHAARIGGAFFGLSIGRNIVSFMRQCDEAIIRLADLAKQGKLTGEELDRLGGTVGLEASRKAVEAWRGTLDIIKGQVSQRIMEIMFTMTDMASYFSGRGIISSKEIFANVAESEQRHAALQGRQEARRARAQAIWDSVRGELQELEKPADKMRAYREKLVAAVKLGAMAAEDMATLIDRMYDKLYPIRQKLAAWVQGEIQRVKRPAELMPDYHRMVLDAIRHGEITSGDLAERLLRERYKELYPAKRESQTPHVGFTNERFLHFRPGTVFGPQAEARRPVDDSALQAMVDSARTQIRSLEMLRRIETGIAKLASAIRDEMLYRRLMNRQMQLDFTIGVANL